MAVYRSQAKGEEHMSGDHNQYQMPDVVVKTIRVREVEIEFTEWLHPQMGVVPVDPKTPLILKAKIREEL
jgi:hypothetical protein